ncbi:hypothetical protein WJM97_02210 [Okeanomitos corallinicola TIOX110]|uniref:Uncharacterized protein n=1 Tax=Okeanomitos corallinicola TIOX110 TaxID=3133117 RepID=A0ABZ2UYB2_9CYAN
MAEKSLQDVLGSNASQTSTQIFLDKTDIGLSPSESHSADQIISAIAITAKPILNQAQFDAEYEQKVYISEGFKSFTSKNDGTNDIEHRVDQIVINLAKEDDTSLNPEDY